MANRIVRADVPHDPTFGYALREEWLKLTILRQRAEKQRRQASYNRRMARLRAK